MSELNINKTAQIPLILTKYFNHLAIKPTTLFKEHEIQMPQKIIMLVCSNALWILYSIRNKTHFQLISFSEAFPSFLVRGLKVRKK